jgi:hypothetical protein
LVLQDKVIKAEMYFLTITVVAAVVLVGLAAILIVLGVLLVDWVALVVPGLYIQSVAHRLPMQREAKEGLRLQEHIVARQERAMAVQVYTVFLALVVLAGLVLLLSPTLQVH